MVGSWPLKDRNDLDAVCNLPNQPCIEIPSPWAMTDHVETIRIERD